MSNLTRTAWITRKAINSSLIAVVIFLVLRMVWLGAKSYWKNRHPAPPPPPTVAFGKLPAIKFKEEKQKPQKEFVLQTIEGNLPELPAVGKVFFVVDKEHKFLALDQTNQIAKNLGFFSPPEKLEEDLFRYQNQVLNLTLTINPLTKTLRYQYPYLSDQTLANNYLSSQQEVISAASRFLSKLERDHSDLVSEKIKVTLLKISGGEIQQAASISETNLARVDFFRDNIEEYPLYPNTMEKANVSFLVTSNDAGNRQILDVYYTYFYINQEKFATYPLKPISTAWEELKNGNYHLAKLSLPEKAVSIPIRRIYLAYFDPHYPTNFLQPIYVFEGDYDFFGFVPAISIEWISE